MSESEESNIIRKKREVQKIGARNVSVIFLLGIAGQIAWAVENSWFNTFVFDKISTGSVPKSTVISWMVGVSAIVATLTTIFMGTLSDRTYTRWGRRKPYIVLGYFIWGFTTALFPMVAWIKNAGIVVVMVVIADAIMSFFGSSANDAAFNAWLTDIGHSSNRNRIQSMNFITSLVANMIALGAAGIIIDSFENGYFIFFFGLGGIVTLTGLISQFLIKEEPVPVEKREKYKPYWKEIIGILSPGLIKENSVLYLLFIAMALSGAASQITAPYSFIYIEHYLGFSKSMISLIGLIIILASTAVLALMGGISHKFNRKNLMILMGISGTVFSILMAYQTSLVGLTIVYFLSLSSGLSASVILAAWMQDKYPEGDIGRFQGIRMIFFVLLPMVIGPPIGAYVIENFGKLAIIDGELGIVPPPQMFVVSAIAGLFALIPLFFIKRSEGAVKFLK